MGVSNFIPELWAARLAAHLDKAHVYVNRCNRDYEGEIKEYGDTVRIGQVGPVSVANYVPNQTTITPEELTGVQTLLTIDKARYFAFKIDDVDKAQTKPKLMDEAMGRAAYALADAVDDELADLYAQAGNSITTQASSVNSSTVLEAVGAAQQVLDEADVPVEGRWLIVPPWFNTKIAIARIIQTDGSVDANRAWETGYVGRLMSFDIFMSNNVPTTGTAPSYTSYLLGGHSMAISYAEQILKTEAYRLEASFGDGVKGLHVYGHKVVNPNALVAITAIYKAEA